LDDPLLWMQREIQRTNGVRDVLVDERNLESGVNQYVGVKFG